MRLERAAPARPRQVLAEFSIGAPIELWHQLRDAAGGELTRLPAQPALALGFVMGLPPLTASRIDLSAPVVGVLAGEGSAELVIGVHVQSGAELVADVTTGAGATHRLASNGPVRILAPAAGDGRTLAVVNDVLLTGARAALECCAAYVAEALAKERFSAPALRARVPREALHARIAPELNRLWAQRRDWLAQAVRTEVREQGRPADFGDPEALVTALDATARASLALLERSSELGADLSVQGETWELSARASAESSADRAALAEAVSESVDERELARLPKSTAMAVLFAHDESGPERPWLAAFGRALTPKLGIDQQRAFNRGLANWRAGLGKTQAIAVLDDFALVWRGQVADPVRLREGVLAGVSWLDQAAFLPPMAALAGRARVGEHVAEVRAAGVSTDRFAIELSPRPQNRGTLAKPRRFALTSSIDQQRFLLTFASRDRDAFGAALAAESGGDVAVDPDAKALLVQSSNRAFVFYADLQRLGLAAGKPAPLLADVGLRDGAPALTVRLSRAAVAYAVARGLAP